MKRTDPRLLALMAQRGTAQPLACCVRLKRQDGTIVRFTDHDSDIVISGWIAPDDPLNGTYLANPGFDLSDIEGSSSLDVHNAEITTPQSAPAPLETDVHAGAWDYCDEAIVLVNYADLTMGPHYLHFGTTGELSIEKTGGVRTEVRGLLQALSQTVGKLVSPTCLNTFGDTRCGVDLTPFTFTGTVDAISADGLTLYDAGRTEPGAGAGVAISNITNANPGHVTLAAVLNLVDGQAVTISGVLGMTNINAVTLVLNPTGLGFDLTVNTTDTSAYPAYISDGTVTPIGGGRSAFDTGKITFTSGLNDGLSMDVKTYTTGQITLVLPMPFTVAPGDAYIIVQGCGKAFETNCIGDYANGDRFGGFPHLRGLDQLIQIGKPA